MHTSWNRNEGALKYMAYMLIIRVNYDKRNQYSILVKFIDKCFYNFAQIGICLNHKVEVLVLHTYEGQTPPSAEYIDNFPTGKLIPRHYSKHVSSG